MGEKDKSGAVWVEVTLQAGTVSSGTMATTESRQSFFEQSKAWNARGGDVSSSQSLRGRGQPAAFGLTVATEHYAEHW